MIEVRNLLFQPLTFHLNGGNASLHLGPRRRRLIERKKVSPELKRAAQRGFVSLTAKADPGGTDRKALPSKMNPERAMVPPPGKSPSKRPRKGRD